ncbi:MAG TPA: NAD(+) diphosphatase [Rhizomicrobium sp.]|nr:NAD(+) diphosphatase [Rhizomicrobium sp.]
MIPFCGNPLNRASEKRPDAQWIASQRRLPSALVLPLWKLQPFLLGGAQSSAPFELGLLRSGLCETMASSDAPEVFLGLEGEVPIFALDISAARDPENEGPLAGLGHFREARAAAMGLPLKDAAIFGQAKAMIDWHNRHGFCARCGAATAIADAGYKRTCPNCAAEHFPRTDPVVIMLATQGEDCLVGRGPQFPPGFFSALAGFVEPGETVEEAVARELHEEAGIRVRDVTYFATQPWPFPSSLMIGCFAKAESRELVIDHNELADAFWLPKSKLRALLAGEEINGLRVPPPIAIAHHLLKEWAGR